MNIFERKIDGVPQFVSFFAPVINVLRDLGGQARPKEVFDEIAKRYDVEADQLAQVNKNGNRNSTTAWHGPGFTWSKLGSCILRNAEFGRSRMLANALK